MKVTEPGLAAARAANAALSPERRKEISRMGVAARLARSTPERRREIARLGALATNRKRWGAK